MKQPDTRLALLGGTPVIHDPVPESLFRWPIITKEDEDAALDVIRRGAFSGLDVTEQFQIEFAAWQGTKYALAFCNGTAALTAAMFAVGLERGDEIICPTKTYWGSVSQSMYFGAAPVFCNIDEHLSIDPDDIERCITPRTKALVIVHYCGYPCDMDRIMPIVKKHGIKLIEDVSHAQGGLYKGKKLGTFGDVAAMSLMSGKSFAIGEGGMLVTDDTRIYERAMAYGHYERFNAGYIKESEELKPYFHIPLGGIKGRINQVSSAIGRVQLKYYDARCAEIRRAMNYFWDLLEGVPGIRPLRVDEADGSDMAGWYNPQGIYVPEELDGLPVGRFCEAMRAEVGGIIWDGANFCLHTHNYFKTFDIDGSGVPARIRYEDRDVREDDDKCEPSTRRWCFSVPWFKHYDKEWIETYALAFRKVALNHDQLLEGAAPDKAMGGHWYGFTNDQ